METELRKILTEIYRGQKENSDEYRTRNTEHFRQELYKR